MVYQAHAAKHHYQFQRGEASKIDRTNKCVVLDTITDDQGEEVLKQREVGYNILVMAIGSISNDFGIPGVGEFCHMLDSKQQATGFQKSLSNQLLRNQHDLVDSTPTRIAIVGAGPTGVELSAELLHMLESISYYNANEKQEIDIVLIEAEERILSSLPVRISESVSVELEALGISTLTSTSIISANESGFIDKGGSLIEADLMVWAAGVKSDQWLEGTGLELNRNNQLVCQSTLQSVSDNSISAIFRIVAVFFMRPMIALSQG